MDVGHQIVGHQEYRSSGMKDIRDVGHEESRGSKI